VDWGYHTLTFQDTIKEFAVNRGDLLGLNYTKSIFGRVTARTPLVGWGEDTPPFPCSWPHFLDQSYTPDYMLPPRKMGPSLPAKSGTGSTNCPTKMLRLDWKSYINISGYGQIMEIKNNWKGN